ncbi:MAG TPA: hypothetical protein VG603_02445 [Chitinophagales bacterium]|nr:hypothetical protein [Chitinophagales bacterium]
MKKLIAILLLVITIGFNNTVKAIKPAEVTFQVFYDELSPYGAWVNYPTYGYV